MDVQAAQELQVNKCLFTIHLLDFFILLLKLYRENYHY